MTTQLPIIVQHLQTVPREVVHNILNDVPLGKVLQLASYETPYLESCILGHFVYEKFFTSKDELHRTQRYFELYCELTRYFRVKISPAKSLLSRSVATTPHSHTFTYTNLINELHDRCFAMLEKAQPHLPLLQRFATPESLKCLRPVWNSSQLGSLRNRWDAIKQAETSYNTLKSSQLSKLAALADANSDVLKRLMDAAKTPRPNHDHIVALLRVGAKRLINSRMLVQITPPRYTFRYDMLPLVPFNNSLAQFLEELKRHGIKPDKSSSPPIAVVDFPSTFSLAAQTDIQTVVKGLAYVYTVPDHRNGDSPVIPRTKYTPYSVVEPHKPHSSALEQTPQFVLASDLDDERDGNRLLPYPEEEFDWLEAFIRSIRLFESL